MTENTATAAKVAEIAAARNMSQDLVQDLFGRAQNLQAPFSATKLATSTRTMLQGKGYKVSQHVRTCCLVLDALTEGGILVRNGQNRYRLADAPAPAPKAKAAVRNTCRCSADCTATTRKSFAQGHDARMVSRLVGEIVTDGLLAHLAEREIRAAGGSDNLVAKLHKAVTKALARKDKAAAREVAENGKRLADKVAADKPVVRAKVGRWEYEGTLTDSPEFGLQFTYTDRKGVSQTVTRFRQV